MSPKRKMSLMSLAIYVFVVGLPLFLAVSNAIQTWPNNAIGYAVGASNPIPTIQARWFPDTGQTTVLGRPTLSSDFINQVLQAAHSPAQGTGQALYTLSVQYGIDDAYALAFFKHESQYGTTGIAQETRSLGNIRCSAGYQCINGYRSYSSWIAGEADDHDSLYNRVCREDCGGVLLTTHASRGKKADRHSRESSRTAFWICEIP